MVAMSCFLIYAMFMRMDWFPDYFHDADNDIMGGVAEAGFSGDPRNHFLDELGARTLEELCALAEGIACLARVDFHCRLHG